MQGFLTGATVILKGYSGGVAEYNYTPTGKLVCKFGLATGGTTKTPTTWFNCQIWEDEAREVEKYLTGKGLAVEVKGRWNVGEYNSKKYLDINVTSMQIEHEGELIKVNLPDEKDFNPKSEKNRIKKNKW